MHKLAAYLKQRKITFAEFGGRIGRTQSTVSRICAGKVNLNRATVLAIYRETGGAVTPNDLFGIIETEAGE